MRTLKKTLCLVLVLAMVLSCGILASADFTDAEEIEYTEAAEVLNAIGVITGYEDGSFQANKTLTRAEACVIIARLLGAEDLKGKAPFTDMAGYENWAESAIAFCANEGIVNGVGDGKFDPAGDLTGSAWLKMLAVALGYDAEEYGMTGETWDIGVAKVAKQLELTAGNASVDQTAAVTREEACLYALNALKHTDTPDVYQVIKTDGTDVTVIGEFDSLLDAALYASVLNSNVVGTETYTAEQAPATDSLLATVHDVTYKAVSEDAYGRPAATYTNAKGTINLVYCEEPVMSSTGVISKTALEKALGKTATVDGAALANIGAAGTLTEIYATATKGAYKSVSIVTYVDVLAKTDVVAAKDETPAHIIVDNPKFDSSSPENPTTNPKTLTFETTDFAKGDVVLYTLDTDGEVATAVKAEGVAGTVTATGTGYIKLDGEKITLAAGYTNAYKDSTDTVVPVAPGAKATVYCDADGYAKYVVNTPGEEQPETVWNYGYLLKYEARQYDAGTSGLITSTDAKEAAEKFQIVTSEGKTVVLDGAFKVDEDTNNATFVWNDSETPDSAVTSQLIKYALDEEGKVIAVTKVENNVTGMNYSANNTFVKGQAQMKQDNGTYRTWILTADTVFIYKTDTNKYSAYTGYQNAPSFTSVANVSVLADVTTGVVEAVYVPAAADAAPAQKNLVYVADNAYEATLAADGKTTVNVYEDCYVDGVKTTLTLKGTDTIADSGLYEYSVDSNGIAKIESADLAVGTATANAVAATYFRTTGGIYYVTGTTEYYEITDEGVVAVDGITLSNTTTVTILYTDGTAGNAEKPASVVYIVVEDA
ncbi:MAG: S-layer homology domain-containing protein [Oscillospiraceae bacterium]